MLFADPWEQTMKKCQTKQWMVLTKINLKSQRRLVKTQLKKQERKLRMSEAKK